MRRSLLILMFIALTAVIFGCSSDKNVYETVEVFSIETYSDEPNSAGMYVNTGYKKVNAITYAEESKNELKFEVFVIEDFYDNSGAFIESIIKYQESTKNLVTMYTKNHTNDKKSNQPLTILAPEFKPQIDLSLEADLSDEQKKQVKEHIMRFIETIED